MIPIYTQWITEIKNKEKTEEDEVEEVKEDDELIAFPNLENSSFILSYEQIYLYSDYIAHCTCSLSEFDYKKWSIQQMIKGLQELTTRSHFDLLSIYILNHIYKIYTQDLSDNATEWCQYRDINLSTYMNQMPFISMVFDDKLFTSKCNQWKTRQHYNLLARIQILIIQSKGKYQSNKLIKQEHVRKKRKRYNDKLDWLSDPREEFQLLERCLYEQEIYTEEYQKLKNVIEILNQSHISKIRSLLVLCDNNTKQKKQENLRKWNERYQELIENYKQQIQTTTHFTLATDDETEEEEENEYKYADDSDLRFKKRQIHHYLSNEAIPFILKYSFTGLVEPLELLSDGLQSQNHEEEEVEEMPIEEELLNKDMKSIKKIINGQFKGILNTLWIGDKKKKLIQCLNDFKPDYRYLNQYYEHQQQQEDQEEQRQILKSNLNQILNAYEELNKKLNNESKMKLNLIQNPGACSSSSTDRCIPYEWLSSLKLPIKWKNKRLIKWKSICNVLLTYHANKLLEKKV
jgi:hypothetical protein